MIRRTKKSSLIAALTTVCIILLGQAAGSAVTLEQVRQRDELVCGVSADLPGFSKADQEGNWRGLNIDVCRAVAAAVLGDAAKARFVPLSETDALTAVLSGEVDLLSMNLEWNLSFDTSVGIDFCGVSFFDGQGFMITAKREVSSVLELQNSTICPDPEASQPALLEEFFTTHDLQYKVVETEALAGLNEAVLSEKCDTVSGPISRLAALRLQFPQPENFLILPETISRRPLGPVVRQGDDGWFNVVRWVLFALKIAEDEGITSANIETMKASNNPDINKLLGLEGIGGKGLGLTNDWVVQIISQVGNYGEIFERNLGRGSELNLDRNLNELWSRGGLHYGPAVN